MGRVASTPAIQRRWGVRALATAAFLLAVSGVPALGEAAPPSSPGPGGGRAGDVATLRVEVDELAQRLRARRGDVRDELAGMRAEKAELERRLRLAQVRQRTLQKLQARADEAADDLQDQAHAWVGPARRAIDVVRGYVQRSLPFATSDRLASLDEIAGQLDRAEPDVGRAMQRLWRFVEQEVAMTGEVSLSQQPVRLDGATRAQLADVLRLGMALMYVRTAEGELAWAVPHGEGLDTTWVLERIEDPQLEEAVEQLFEAHEQNRGYGPIDLAIPAGLLEHSEVRDGG